MNRRHFLQTAGVTVGLPFLGKAAPAETLKISLNAYSFNKLLNDAIRGRGEGTTLMKLLDFAVLRVFA